MSEIGYAVMFIFGVDKRYKGAKFVRFYRELFLKLASNKIHKKISSYMVLSIKISVLCKNTTRQYNPIEAKFIKLIIYFRVK